MKTVARDVRCSLCGSTTSRGVLRDSRGLSAEPMVGQWMPHVPHGESMLGRAVAKRTAQSLEIAVTAYRCKDCGHLELFAPR